MDKNKTEKEQLSNYIDVSEVNMSKKEQKQIINK